jgi:hypothetical protein
VRKEVAEFIQRRDGYPRYICSPYSLFFPTLHCVNLFQRVLSLVSNLLDKAINYFVLYFSDPELIYLTDGASKAVMQTLNTIIKGAGDGVI